MKYLYTNTCASVDVFINVHVYWDIRVCVRCLLHACGRTPPSVPPPDPASPWTTPGSPEVPRGPGWTPHPDRFLSQSEGAPGNTNTVRRGSRTIKNTWLQSDRSPIWSMFCHLGLVDAVEAISWCGCRAETSIKWTYVTSSVIIKRQINVDINIINDFT